MKLDAIKMLAREFRNLPDSRPEWLRSIDTDPTSVYYRFLFEFARDFQPHCAFEIGTCEGKSAAHLAAGNPEGTVVTLDVKPIAKELADAFRLPNLVAIVSDSIEALREMKWVPAIDVLFIDGDHTFRNSYGEYDKYRPHVRDGGLIFFDDISISPEMKSMWAAIPDPKASLDGLHYTGFGVVLKDPAISVPTLEDVLGMRRS